MQGLRFFACACAILLAGCSTTGGPGAAGPAAFPTGAPVAVSPVSTARPLSEPPATPGPSTTDATAASPEPAPSAAPAGSVVIGFGPFDAQTELISSSGRRVLIDVEYPDALSRPPTARDILLTTHEHADHYDQPFVASFPGQTLTMRAGTIEADGISVTGVPGQHNQDPLLSIPNYLFLVDIGGFRIAHLGDLGQTAFTAAQLRALGRVDVVIGQLTNGISGIPGGSRIGIDLVNQLRPRLFIPTHLLEDPVGTAKMASAEWPAFYTTKAWITLSRQTLPETTTLVFMGDEAASYGKLTGVPVAPW